MKGVWGIAHSPVQGASPFGGCRGLCPLTLRATEHHIFNTYIPEFQGKGYGSFVVERLKEVYSGLTADRVRPNARNFWLKQGFVDAGDGNYVYVNKRLK